MKKRALAFFSLSFVLFSFGATTIPPPFLYFPFEESIQSVSGSMPVTTSGAVTYSDGMPGFGKSLATAKGWVRAPATGYPGMEPGSGSWTFSFWAKFNWAGVKTANSPFRLFSKGGTGDTAADAPGWQIWVRADYTAGLFYGATGASTRESRNKTDFPLYANVTDKAWNHYAVVRDGDTIRCYVNGKQIASGTLAAGVSGFYGSTTAPTRFTPELDIPEWAEDDIATWCEVLSAEQIAEIYTQGKAGKSLSAIATILTCATRQDGTWENNDTWILPPTENYTGDVIVSNNVVITAATPSLMSVIMPSGSLTLSENAILNITQATKETDSFIIGNDGIASVFANPGAQINVNGVLKIGPEGGGDGTLVLDGATLVQSNGYFSVGRKTGSRGAISAVNGSRIVKDGTYYAVFGLGPDNTTTFGLSDSVFEMRNTDAIVFFGREGGNIDAGVTNSSIAVGRALETGSGAGGLVYADFVRSYVTNRTDVTNVYVSFSSGASTSIVSAVDSVFRMSTAGDAAFYTLRFAEAAGSRSVTTNDNSVFDACAGSVSFATLRDSCAEYVQRGANSRLVTGGKIKLSDGYSSVTDLAIEDGEIVSAQAVSLGGTLSSKSQVRLSGGIFKCPGFTIAVGGDATILFDGGSFVCPSNMSPIFASDHVNILFADGKNSVFDTAGTETAILQPQAPSGNGGIIKEGLGTLRIPATYGGATIVRVGCLKLDGFGTFASGAYTVASGATLALNGTGTSVASLDLSGTLMFDTDGTTRSMPYFISTGSVTINNGASIAFAPGCSPMPGGRYPFLQTSDAALGACAEHASAVPDGWKVEKNGEIYSLVEITASARPVASDNVTLRIPRGQIKALTEGSVAYQFGAFSGTGVIVSNAPRNDLSEPVKAIYFSGDTYQAMHGPSVPTSMTGNHSWACSMWVWSGNRVNHEPTVLTFGCRWAKTIGGTVVQRSNASLNHGSTESRAASFYALDPKYKSGAPALDSWQHIVFSYMSATNGSTQGLTVYVNGEPQPLDLCVNSLTTPDIGQTFLLGNQHESTALGVISRPYEGFISELTVYDTSLTEANVLELFESTKSEYLGETIQPDTDQVFETTDYHNWMDAAGWRNGFVPYGNTATVSGSGVSVLVNSEQPTFKSLIVDNGAALAVKDVKLPPDGTLAVSNDSSVAVLSGGILEPSSSLIVSRGSSLSVTGTAAMVSLTKVNDALTFADGTAEKPNELNILDGASLCSYNSPLKLGCGGSHERVVLRNATVALGSPTGTSATFFYTFGSESGVCDLTASNTLFNSVKETDLLIATSAADASTRANVILDDCRLPAATEGADTFSNLRIAANIATSTADGSYVSHNVASVVMRNKTAIKVSGVFVFGRRNAASGTPAVPSEMSVMTLDDASLSVVGDISIGLYNGRSTLILTNGAQLIKSGPGNFRLSGFGKKGVASTPYVENRLEVYAGSCVEMQTTNAVLTISETSTDNGTLLIGEGGTVILNGITGSGLLGGVVFDGGVLKPHEATNNFITCKAPILAPIGRNVSIDTDGKDITVGVPFGGAGGILKAGEGTLTLSAVSTNTGALTVTGGSVVFTDGAGTLGDVRFSGDGSVRLGSENKAETVTCGTLNLSSDLMLDVTSPGVSDTIVIGNKNGLVSTAGAVIRLRYDETAFDTLFGDGCATYTLFRFLKGVDTPPTIANAPRGWRIVTTLEKNVWVCRLVYSSGTLLLVR